MDGQSLPYPLTHGHGEQKGRPGQLKIVVLSVNHEQFLHNMPKSSGDC
jgi:hypothetical protein